MESIKTALRQNLAENVLFTDEFELSDDASFLEEGIVDSTGVMELVLFAEETFAIHIGDEEITPDNLDSVNKLAAFIERKINGRSR